MQTHLCAGCYETIAPDAVVRQTLVFYRKGQRWGRTTGRTKREVVCPDCQRYGYRDFRDRHEAEGRMLDWGSLIGDEDAPDPCAACGQKVILRTDKRRTVVLCSDTCRARYYAQKTTVERAVTECAECGQPAPAGRSDRAYCSNACRQRAYRNRIR